MLIYHRPHTLTEAAEAARHADIAVAGGGLLFAGEDLAYTHIVDLQAVPECTRVAVFEAGAQFGSAQPLARVLEWGGLPHAMRSALTRTLTPNLLNRVSIGESIVMSAHPLMAEWRAVLMAHDIGVEVLDPETGVSEWESAITLWERGTWGKGLIIGIDIPMLERGEALETAHVARTPADVAIVNAAVFVVHTPTHGPDILLTVCGASAEPLFNLALSDLAGRPFDADAIGVAAAQAAALCAPVGDYRGSAEYRRAMVGVCVRRALEAAQRALTGR